MTSRHGLEPLKNFLLKASILYFSRDWLKNKPQIIANGVEQNHIMPL